MNELKCAGGKSFEISKWEVWRAWLKVKENRGAGGVDGCSIEDFEKDLHNNLYKIWNRMSSGSYFPESVRLVVIAKKDGGQRRLGVPTIGDRIVQTIAASRLEAVVEPIFHSDSFGYRPGRSALDAVGLCRKRCWTMKWAIDLDIAQFFDSVDHALLVKALEHLGVESWIVLYVKRWLTVPMVGVNGEIIRRDHGTPQGSAISPVLANIFMHYAFDMWIAKRLPEVLFERYADDAVLHCFTLKHARKVLELITRRLVEVGLHVHPGKTRIVYVGRSVNDQPGEFETQFDFLGYTFRKREAWSRRGEMFTSFLPAMSKQAFKAAGAVIRQWRIHLHSTYSIVELARWLNPVIRGWMRYYGAFYKTGSSQLRV